MVFDAGAHRLGARSAAQLCMMLVIAETARDGCAQALRGRWIAGRKVAVEAVGQPLGNATYVEGGRGYAAGARLSADHSEGLRPQARNREQIRAVEQIVESVLLEPSGECDREAGVALARAASFLFPSEPVATFACEGEMKWAAERGGCKLDRISEELATFEVFHSSYEDDPMRRGRIVAGRQSGIHTYDRKSDPSHRGGGKSVVEILDAHVLGSYDNFPVAAQSLEAGGLLMVVAPHCNRVQPAASMRIEVGQAERAKRTSARMCYRKLEGLLSANAGAMVVMNETYGGRERGQARLEDGVAEGLGKYHVGTPSNEFRNRRFEAQASNTPKRHVVGGSVIDTNDSAAIFRSVEFTNQGSAMAAAIKERDEEVEILLRAARQTGVRAG